MYTTPLALCYVLLLMIITQKDHIGPDIIKINKTVNNILIASQSK